MIFIISDNNGKKVLVKLLHLELCNVMLMSFLTYWHISILLLLQLISAMQRK